MDAASPRPPHNVRPNDSIGAGDFEISERSRELLGILRDPIKGDAHLLYEAAIRVLADKTNPARLPLAASAVREIMDDLERGAGFKHDPPDWKERILKLEKAWKVAERSLDPADESGGGFSSTLDEFFKNFHGVPSRRKLADGAISALDPSTSLSPPAVRDARAGAWVKFRWYFNRVLHRKDRPTEADFRRELESFETFVFDWLRPPTSADLDALDDVLRQGPPDG